MEQSVSQLLGLELKKRQQNNKTYSLRAFARDLEVSAAYLSYLLNGERKLGPDKAASFAKKMGLSALDSRLLVGLSRYHSARSETSRSMIRRDLESIKKTYTDFDNLKLDQFKIIADWYHLAILEMIDIEGFSSNPTWIAQCLGISVTDSSRALDRLIRLNMIAIRPDGSLQKLKNNAIRDTPSEALRKFHQQHLKNAYRAIDKVPFEKRHTSGTTVAIDPENLEEAKVLIKDFRAKLSAQLSSGRKKEVYHLAIQLFPLSEGNKND